MFERRTFARHYEGAMEPIRILDNVWFVGCFSASSHLIDTGEGLILIDTGYEDTTFLLVDSIYKLGYKPSDVRYIIHTHWHDDHTGATAGFVKISGAKTLVSEKDAPKTQQYFIPDIFLKDGDIVHLGNTSIRIVETPGHTYGTISLFFDAKEGEKTYRVGMFGGAGSNTLKKGHFDYPQCREDYRASLAKLRKEPVDAFIGNHVWNNDTENKGIARKNGGDNPFVDKNLWIQFLDFCEDRLDKVIGEEQNG
jgi:metallo-beta-lactamase class B